MCSASSFIVSGLTVCSSDLFELVYTSDGKTISFFEAFSLAWINVGFHQMHFFKHSTLSDSYFPFCSRDSMSLFLCISNHSRIPSINPTQLWWMVFRCVADFSFTGTFEIYLHEYQKFFVVVFLSHFEIKVVLALYNMFGRFLSFWTFWIVLQLSFLSLLELTSLAILCWAFPCWETVTTDSTSSLFFLFRFSVFVIHYVKFYVSRNLKSLLRIVL